MPGGRAAVGCWSWESSYWCGEVGPLGERVRVSRGAVQACACSDSLKLVIMGHAQVAFLLQKLAAERHQEIELVRRALPVLAGEAVEGELGKALTASFLHGLAYALHPPAVPLHAAEHLVLPSSAVLSVD